MTIANCVRCSRMFQKTNTSRVCPDCILAEEAAFRRIADFLEANPGAEIDALTEGAEVDDATVRRLLKAGRLAALGEAAAGISIDCRQCGKPVITGNYCAECTETIGAALRNSAKMLLSGEKPQGSGPSRSPGPRERR